MDVVHLFECTSRDCVNCRDADFYRGAGIWKKNRNNSSFKLLAQKTDFHRKPAYRENTMFALTRAGVEDSRPVEGAAIIAHRIILPDAHAKFDFRIRPGVQIKYI